MTAIVLERPTLDKPPDDDTPMTMTIFSVRYLLGPVPFTWQHGSRFEINGPIVLFHDPHEVRDERGKIVAEGRLTFTAPHEFDAGDSFDVTVTPKVSDT